MVSFDYVEGIDFAPDITFIGYRVRLYSAWTVTAGAACQYVIIRTQNPLQLSDAEIGLNVDPQGNPDDFVNTKIYDRWGADVFLDGFIVRYLFATIHFRAKWTHR